MDNIEIDTGEIAQKMTRLMLLTQRAAVIGQKIQAMSLAKARKPSVALMLAE